MAAASPRSLSNVLHAELAQADRRSRNEPGKDALTSTFVLDNT
jgi:hypothetical protein